MLHAREFTVGIRETRFIRHANQRPGGVKQVDQHKGEDHAGQAQVQGARQIDLTNHRSHARRRRDDPGVMHVAQHPAQQGGHNDRDQYRGVNVARRQNRDDKEAQHAQQYAVGSQMTNADQRFRIGDNHPGVFQAHHADKQADTAGDTYTQAKRNIGDHPVTYAEDGQQQQAHGAPEDGAHAHLPRQPHRLHHHKGEKGVQAHRRRQGDRQVREQTHQDTAESGNQTGGHKHGAGIHARYAKNLWVNKNDIHHRQERGETGDGFGAHRGAVLAQLKYALQQTLARRLAGLLLTHYRFPNVRRENSRLSYTKLRHQARLYGNFFHLFCLYGNDCVAALSITKTLNLLIWKGYDSTRSSIF